MREADGRVYMGQWLANQKHGWGVMQWPNDEKSEANWQSNIRCGLSIFTDASGKRYIEKWNRGNRDTARIPLKRAEKDIKPFLNATEKAEWQPDSKFKACFKCDAPFTVMNRRHHCRHCGSVFCGSCTSKKLSLDNIGSTEPARVCDECFVCVKVHEVMQKLKDRK
jgi:FYVE zinc finger/MORN repeat